MGLFQVSSGAIDKAKKNLESMLKLCAAPVDSSSDPELALIQKKALNEVTYELIRQVTSPTDLLRQQVSLRLCHCRFILLSELVLTNRQIKS